MLIRFMWKTLGVATIAGLIGGAIAGSVAASPSSTKHIAVPPVEAFREDEQRIDVVLRSLSSRVSDLESKLVDSRSDIEGNDDLESDIRDLEFQIRRIKSDVSSIQLKVGY